MIFLSMHTAVCDYKSFHKTEILGENVSRAENEKCTKCKMFKTY